MFLASDDPHLSIHVAPAKMRKGAALFSDAKYAKLVKYIEV